MRESDLANRIIEKVKKSAIENNVFRVEKVKLTIGKLSRVIPANLETTFNSIVDDEIFKGTVLEIEEQDILCECLGCGEQFSANKEHILICPACNGSRVYLISGREISIDYYVGHIQE